MKKAFFLAGILAAFALFQNAEAIRNKVLGKAFEGALAQGQRVELFFDSYSEDDLFVTVFDGAVPALYMRIDIETGEINNVEASEVRDEAANLKWRVPKRTFPGVRGEEEKFYSFELQDGQLLVSTVVPNVNCACNKPPVRYGPKECSFCMGVAQLDWVTSAFKMYGPLVACAARNDGNTVAVVSECGQIVVFYEVFHLDDGAAAGPSGGQANGWIPPNEEEIVAQIRANPKVTRLKQVLEFRQIGRAHV